MVFLRLLSFSLLNRKLIMRRIALPRCKKPGSGRVKTLHGSLAGSEGGATAEGSLTTQGPFGHRPHSVRCSQDMIGRSGRHRTLFGGLALFCIYCTVESCDFWESTR
jgi:hypothetical protein